jgi:anaerobic selenocysteine-containing dehydrogenase
MRPRSRRARSRRGHQDRSLFLPATQVAEIDGTFTNTQRMLQFHHKAAEAPGDCRSDTWFYYDLGKRLKKLYAQSTSPRDEGFKNLVWDYEHDNRKRAQEGRASALKILKELNGFFTGRSRSPLRRLRRSEGRWFDDLRVVDLLGRFPAADKNLAAIDARPIRPASPARS